jgi:hypothetical protein
MERCYYWARPWGLSAIVFAIRKASVATVIFVFIVIICFLDNIDINVVCTSLFDVGIRL